MSRIAAKYIRFGTSTGDVSSRNLPANYTPTNYTPSQVASEGTDKTSAHLKGIDTALGSISGGTPTIFGSRSAPRVIVAATGITSGASHMSTTAPSQDIYLEGSITGDSVAATISAGTIDGQTMRLLGRTDSKTVTLNTTTTNVDLNGSMTLGAGDVITLRWDTVVWQEVSRNN